MDLRILPAALLASLLIAAPLAAQESYEARRRTYEEGMKRPPLGKRAGVLDRFAQTRDPRALELILARYAKPKLPKEQERYLIAEVVGRYYGAAEFDAAKLRFLGRHASAEDAWLWFHAGRSRFQAPEEKDPFVQTARVAGYTIDPQPEELAMIAPLLAATAADSLKGALLTEQASALLLAQRVHIRTPEFQQAALALIERLHDDAPTQPRTRLVIARHFAQLFDVERVTLRAQYWRQLLSFEEVKDLAGPTGEGRPRFFGAAATGERIAFLIDLSDSMLEPLTEHELADAKRIEPGTEAKQSEIDWAKVRTRFDLARLFLARYLLSLGPETRFVVIGFGDTARPLGATKGLVKASRGTVNSVIRELAKIEPTSPTKLHPYGRLRGDTNIHSAFQAAFDASTGRTFKGVAFVQPLALTTGCDTIFLLSDGKPTKDNFEAPDRRTGTGKVVINRETGETGDGGGTALFRGPYVRTRYLLDDVGRMNLFRKAEIHTIAMGGADAELMRGLADLGLGSYRSIGLRAEGGRIARWWVVRPIPAADVAQWGGPRGAGGEPAGAEGPEAVLKSGFSRAAVYKPAEQWLGWSELVGDRKHGVVELGSEANSCAYAYAAFVPDEDLDADLHVGAREAVRVWVNGELVLDQLAPEASFRRDAHKVAIKLKPGPNPMLVKVCSRDGKLRFHARLTTPDGKPLSFRVQ